MNFSISLVILCLNEELGLKSTYDHYKKQLLELSIDHEIIIVNDGSTDQTARIAENIKRSDKSVTVLTNDRPKGMGHGYKRGLKKASKDFYMFSGCDSAPSEQDIKRLIISAQGNDLVLAYVTNSQIRAPFRQFLSGGFTFLMSAITGLRLQYYNAMVIARTSHLRRVNVRSDGYTFCAEFAAKLLKHYDCNYCEVPITIHFGKKKTKKNFKLGANFFQAFKFFVFLFFDIYFARKKILIKKDKK
tara:strand:+ start:155 stop:889 length:735 start_codon:yes stop_codon:yes gene_type:complete